MAAITQEFLRLVTATIGQYSVADVWLKLERQYPAVLRVLLTHKESLGRLDNRCARLLLIALESFAVGKPVRFEQAEIEKRIASFSTSSDSGTEPSPLIRLGRAEPELTALLAFFLKTVEGYATPSETETCRRLFGAIVESAGATTGTASRRRTRIPATAAHPTRSRHSVRGTLAGLHAQRAAHRTRSRALNDSRDHGPRDPHRR